MSFDPARVMILSGPSGVGKDSVLDRWMQRNPKVERVIAVTTRAPREGEIDGRSYHFVSQTEFDRARASGQFLEAKNVHGNWYATPMAGIEAILKCGGIAILKIDVQGAREVVAKHPEVLTVFLLPPSMDELERRIRGRQTDPDSSIVVRLKNAKDEICASSFYQYRLVNDDLEKVVDQLEAIVTH
ncbi:MAG: guanylate kinase [Fimbriimonadaceae bacterium]|nr:guanylate kinase [Fimbriimonadaceae bacterium]